MVYVSILFGLGLAALLCSSQATNQSEPILALHPRSESSTLGSFVSSRGDVAVNVDGYQNAQRVSEIDNGLRQDGDRAETTNDAVIIVDPEGYYPQSPRLSINEIDATPYGSASQPEDRYNGRVVYDEAEVIPVERVGSWPTEQQTEDPRDGRLAQQGVEEGDISTQRSETPVEVELRPVYRRVIEVDYPPEVGQLTTAEAVLEKGKTEQASHLKPASRHADVLPLMDDVVESTIDEELMPQQSNERSESPMITETKSVPTQKHLQPRADAGHAKPPAVQPAVPRAPQAPHGAANAPPPAVPNKLKAPPAQAAFKTFVQKVVSSTPVGTIGIGSPPKNVDVILDTGSNKLLVKSYATIAREIGMVDAGIDRDILPSDNVYDHNRSSTYKVDYIKFKGADVEKHGYILYGSGFAVTDEGKDNVLIGSTVVKNFTVSEIRADDLHVLHDANRIHGVAGLQHMMNRSAGESLFSRMRDNGQLTAFGLCTGPNETGNFIWNDQSTDGAPAEVIGNIHWAVNLTEMKLQGQDKKDPPNKTSAIDVSSILVQTEQDYKNDGWPFGGGAGGDMFHHDLKNPPMDPLPFCSAGKCVAIIDTGSNIIAGPNASMNALRKQINMAADCSNLDSLPTLEFTLGGVKVALNASEYTMKINLSAAMSAKPGGGANPAEGAGEHAPGTFTEGQHNSRQHRLPHHQRAHQLHPLQDVLHRLRKTLGLDLTAGIGEIMPEDVQKIAGKTTICNPALVDLDSVTQHGQLWVIGAPLFRRYYTRWSWPREDPTPKIFFKELSKASACAAPPAASTPKDEAKPPVLHGQSPPKAPQIPQGQMIRAEGRPAKPESHLQQEAVHFEPPMLNIHSIQVPQWALNLEQL